MAGNDSDVTRVTGKEGRMDLAKKPKGNLTKRVIIKICVFIVAIVIWAIGAPLGSGYAGDDPMAEAGVKSLLETKKAPDFSLEDLDGNRVKLEEFRGKPVLLVFWATW